MTLILAWLWCSLSSCSTCSVSSRSAAVPLAGSGLLSLAANSLRLLLSLPLLLGDSLSLSVPLLLLPPLPLFDSFDFLPALLSLFPPSLLACLPSFLLPRSLVPSMRSREETALPPPALEPERVFMPSFRCVTAIPSIMSEWSSRQKCCEITGDHRRQPTHRCHSCSVNAI